MPKQHFLIACGSPIKQSKHPAIDDIITRLMDAEIIDEVDSDILGPCIKYQECNIGITEHKIYARVCAEKILIDCVHGWLRNLNLASYNTESTSGGFVACDILLEKTITEYDVLPFCK